MSWEEDFEKWFRRRMRRSFSRGWFFQDIDEMVCDMEEMMNKELENSTSRIPKDYVRERELPDGRRVRELGPVVYGYSMTIDPEGKPIIREFGNVHLGRRGPMIKEEREPLIDVINTDDEVTVVAELPGVDKKEIKLHALDNKLTISVDTRDRKYYKEVNLGEDIEPNEAKTSYKNGVLKVTYQKAMKRKPKGEPIKLE